MKTFMEKKETADNNKKWIKVDAEGQTLGRMATRIATILQGKHKPTYTPHVDTGDFVVVVNANKIAVTGRKITQKRYPHYTGYPGGLKWRGLDELLEKKPEDVIKLAVRRMLPKNKLGRKMFRKLKVYAGTDHPHEAQNPVEMKLM